jgi:hypothetical protein
MKSPSTTVELAMAIESMIASYLDSVRDAAEQAVARALARQGQELGRGSSKAPVRRTNEPKSHSHSHSSRRTASALNDACQALSDLVRARPGSSMVELAEQLSSSVVELQLPMAKLRTEGRVRTVGQRHLMRYFPAVVRASKE